MNIRNLWNVQHVDERHKNYHFTWGEIDRHWTLPRITINGWHDGHSTLVLGLIYVSLYINIPKMPGIGGFGGGAYGWYFSQDALVLEWKKHSKFLYYPWSWSFYKSWVLATTWGNDVDWLEIPRKFHSKNFAKMDKSPYFYRLKSGVIQPRVAEFYTERREWRMRWLKWSPWPRMVRTSIDVSFNAEVGEDTGSWKGGTTGCSYDMLPGETALQTLRRMQNEREFK